jgi:hypothetical protein
MREMLMETLSNTLSYPIISLSLQHPIVHYFPYESERNKNGKTRKKRRTRRTKQATQQNNTKKDDDKRKHTKIFSIKIRNDFFSLFLNKNYSAHKSDFDWTKLPGARFA